jgi:hypothetical protein
MCAMWVLIVLTDTKQLLRQLGVGQDRLGRYERTSSSRSVSGSANSASGGRGDRAWRARWPGRPLRNADRSSASSRDQLARLAGPPRTKASTSRVALGRRSIGLGSAAFPGVHRGLPSARPPARPSSTRRSTRGNGSGEHGSDGSSIQELPGLSRDGPGLERARRCARGPVTGCRRSVATSSRQAPRLVRPSRPRRSSRPRSATSAVRHDRAAAAPPSPAVGRMRMVAPATVDSCPSGGLVARPPRRRADPDQRVATAGWPPPGAFTFAQGERGTIEAPRARKRRQGWRPGTRRQRRRMRQQSHVTGRWPGPRRPGASARSTRPDQASSRAQRAQAAGPARPSRPHPPMSAGPRSSHSRAWLRCAPARKWARPPDDEGHGLERLA